MACFRSRLVLPVTALSLIFSNSLEAPSLAEGKAAGEKGSEVYCFMRTSGNDHEVSWNAAYNVIKRQKSSLFKTSPKHAAVMILETVVADPNKYSDCGSYLGDLFGPEKILPIKENAIQDTKQSSTKEKGDRYSY